MDNSALKDVLKGVSDAGVLVSDVSGGIKLKEFSELLAVGQDVPAIIADGPLVLKQYLALDDAGRADLDAYAATLPIFPANAQVDGIAKKILLSAIAASAVIAIWQAASV